MGATVSRLWNIMPALGTGNGDKHAENLKSGEMPCIVDCENADEPVWAKLEASNTTIGCGNPDGTQLWRVERAYQVQRQNADRACVREEGDAPARVMLNRLVQLARSAIQHLPVALAAEQ